MFPIDEETITYLELTGAQQGAGRARRGLRQGAGLWHDASREPAFSEYLELDLATIVPSIAGPKRPQDRVAITDAKQAFREALPTYAGAPTATRNAAPTRPASTSRSRRASCLRPGQPVRPRQRPGRQAARVGTGNGGTQRTKPTRGHGGRHETEIDHGHVVIAAITSCTNTSNPQVMIGAALRQERRRARADQQAVGRRRWPPGPRSSWTTTRRPKLTPYLEKLGFYLVGYGCTTCIGNSGPLPEPVSKANDADLAVVSVLSGNRNFEGRINPDVKMNYLASPPLVIAYALAGSMDVDLNNDPLGQDADGNDVFLHDIWPSPQEVQRVIDHAVSAEMFSKDYADVFAGTEQWQPLPTPRATRSSGTRRAPTCGSPALRRMPPSRPRRGHQPAPAPWRCSVTR